MNSNNDSFRRVQKRQRDLEELLAVNSVQMQEQLARQLEMTQQSISNAYAEWERFRKKEDGCSVKLLRNDNARPHVAFDTKDVVMNLGW